MLYEYETANHTYIVKRNWWGKFLTIKEKGKEEKPYIILGGTSKNGNVSRKDDLVLIGSTSYTFKELKKSLERVKIGNRIVAVAPKDNRGNPGGLENGLIVTGSILYEHRLI